MPVITLTTEWKPDDIYNGIIKGKICNLCPGTIIIDNAGSIAPFDIAHASFIIRNTFGNYPEGSVHIICVHSEADNKHDHLIVRAKEHFFVGTDNGIFNLILNSEPDEIIKIDCGDSTDELDIYARVAADIISGKKPADLGTQVDAFYEELPLRATIDKNVIIGSIIFIDSYGNAMSNITRDVFYRVFENKEYRILIQSNKNFTNKISQKYSDVPVGEMLARFNQFDLLEISINGADISELLNISTGSVVRVDNTDKSASPNRLF
ncbi:MAG TPA: SAM-dependent chlorinase/fluorinase [Bacteroidales bacterium]|nr:SAM-dependent chlorinase/fluorinase [Bacteroidales bacterium]HPT22044.1 SAM-dependent chlorinase/fluorinase [Bacteroidales bacterium]